MYVPIHRFEKSCPFPTPHQDVQREKTGQDVSDQWHFLISLAILIAIGLLAS
jgi:hypothetical protein